MSKSHANTECKCHVLVRLFGLEIRSWLRVPAGTQMTEKRTSTNCKKSARKTSAPMSIEPCSSVFSSHFFPFSLDFFFFSETNRGTKCRKFRIRSSQITRKPDSSLLPRIVFIVRTFDELIIGISQSVRRFSRSSSEEEMNEIESPFQEIRSRSISRHQIRPQSTRLQAPSN